AMVTLADGLRDVLDTLHVSYRVHEVANVERPLDTTVTRPVRDTVILSVNPSTYDVTLDGLPAQCNARHGTLETVVIAQNENTAIARYAVNCAPSLRLFVETSGVTPTGHYVWQLSGPTGDLNGLVGANDSLVFSTLAPGDYSLSVRPLQANCILTTDGGATQRFAVLPTGGARVTFQVLCSDVSRAPVIRRLVTSYRNGVAVLVADIADPDRDLSTYYFQ